MTRAVGVALALVIIIGFAAALGLGALRTGGSSFAPIESYDVLDDGQMLVLAIGVGRLTSIGSVAAEEDASSVRLRVPLLHHPGTATADLLRIDVRTYLGSPLGSRSVLDQDGRVIPRRASGVAGSASPTPPALASGAGLRTIDAEHARLVSAVVALVSAYNAGDLDAVLSLVGDKVVWSDCDYRAQNVIGLHQPASHGELSAFLGQRFADHDQLEMSSVSFATGEQPGSVGQAVSVVYGRRTSDTIRALGFTNGILGPRATKIAFSRRTRNPSSSETTSVVAAIRLESVGRLVRHLRHVFRSGVAVVYCGRPVGR